jgi:hypothetical protein
MPIGEGPLDEKTYPRSPRPDHLRHRIGGQKASSCTLANDTPQLREFQQAIPFAGWIRTIGGTGFPFDDRSRRSSSERNSRGSRLLSRICGTI